MNKFSIKEMLSLSFTDSLSYIDKLKQHFKQAEVYQRQNGLSDFTNLSQFEKQTQEIVQQFVKALESTLTRQSHWRNLKIFIKNTQERTIILNPLLTIC